MAIVVLHVPSCFTLHAILKFCYSRGRDAAGCQVTCMSGLPPNRAVVLRMYDAYNAYNALYLWKFCRLETLDY